MSDKITDEVRLVPMRASEATALYDLEGKRLHRLCESLADRYEDGLTRDDLALIADFEEGEPERTEAYDKLKSALQPTPDAGEDGER